MIAVEHRWLSAAAVDMRCGIDSLTALVLGVSAQGVTPHTAYVFCNSRGTRLKVLVWDGLGFWLCARRLERGRFVLPVAGCARVELSAEQFAWLTDGVDWQRSSVSARAFQCV